MTETTGSVSLGLQVGLTSIVFIGLYYWLKAIKSIKGYLTAGALLLIYGLYIFPALIGIVDGILWRMHNTDGVLTYSYVTIEESWTNPQYLALLLYSFASSYGGIFWLASYLMIFLLAKVRGKN